MKTQSSTIVIIRVSNLKHCFRSYSIYLDGEKIQKIKNGETLKINSEPGSHQIGIKLDFIKSELFKINIGDGEMKCVEITLPPANWKSKISLTTIGVFAGLGGMLFGAIGGGLGAGIGAAIFGSLTGKPQLNEKEIL